MAHPVAQRMMENCGFGPRRNMVLFNVPDNDHDSFERYYKLARELGLDWPCVLFSYGSLMNRGVAAAADIRKLRGLIGERAVIAIDSGGFQAGTGKGIYNQEEVFNFQVSSGADMAFNFDIPVTMSISGYTRREWYRFALETTRRSVEWLLKHAEKPKGMLFYAVLHGAPPDTLEEWWRINVEPLLETGFADGVAVGGVVPMSKGRTELVLYWLGFLHDKGVRNVHVFGIGPRWFLMKAARDYFDLVSCDISTALRQAVHEVVKYSHAMTSIRMKAIRKKLRREEIVLHCPCPACTAYRRRYGVSPLELIDSSDRERITYVMLHNFYMILEHVFMLEVSCLKHDCYPYYACDMDYYRQVYRDAFNLSTRSFWAKYKGLFPPPYRELESASGRTWF